VSAEIAANVVAASRRRGIQSGLDESGGCCPTRSVGRATPPLAWNRSLGAGLFYFNSFYINIFEIYSPIYFKTKDGSFL